MRITALAAATARAPAKMNAPRSLRFLCAVATMAVCAASTHNAETFTVQSKEASKLELYDGVTLQIPKDNSTSRVLSFQIDTNKDLESGRGKQKKLMQRILPLFIMPFLLQSAIVPLFLSMLKFMLLKSLMVGKLALALIVLNAFKNQNSVKGRDAEMADIHYGYHGNGMEEYGAYIH